MGNGTVTLLCSGFGLGLYIPGLLASRRLEEKSISTEVLVFENLISKGKRDTILRSRKACHDNFSVALMSARMPMDIRQSIDIDLVSELLASWAKDKKRDFIILSGHWIYIMEDYRSRIAPDTLNADILYVDCDLSPSWKSLKQHMPDYNQYYNEVWLYDFENGKINYQIPISKADSIPYAERPERFLIHGGGWGMGTYRGKLPVLQNKGLSLDIVAYELQEANNMRKGDRCFMVDPSWCAWNRNIYGCHEFPPFGEIKVSENPVFANKKEYHDLFDLTGAAKAIIGKPGAGTLMDSLAAATPIIMLEPFGDHEQKNAALWEQLGFGIPYGKWEDSDFSMGILCELHANLLKGGKAAPDYTEIYKCRNNSLKEGTVIPENISKISWEVKY
jgi:hypothetical protein